MRATTPPYSQEPPINETELDLLARTNLHAFLLEQVFAQAMLTGPRPVASWEKFSEELIHAVRYKTTAPQDDPQLTDMHERLVAHTERFCERVKARVLNP